MRLSAEAGQFHTAQQLSPSWILKEDIEFIGQAEAA